MAPALPRPRTTVYLFKLSRCGGPDMAPALPQARGQPFTGFRLSRCGGPDMAPALPQAADNRLLLQTLHDCGGPYLREDAAERQGGDKQRTEDAFHGAPILRLADAGSGCCL